MLDMDEWVKTAYEAGWVPEQSGHFGEDKSLASTWVQILNYPAFSLVAILTMLS